MRRFVILGSVLIGLVACAAMALARPAEKTKDREPPAVALPEDAIIAIYDRLSDAMEKSPRFILLSPEKYQALLDDIKRLERLSSRAKTRGPSSCLLEGKVAGNLVQFAAKFEFETEKAGESVRLGCGLAQATGVSLDGQTPRLRRSPTEKGDGKADAEGFVVEIDTPGKHLLTLDLVMAVASKSPTQGLTLDLPRAAFTTIDLELPGNVLDVRLGGKPIADKLLTLSRGKLTGGLGPAERLELTWRPAQAGVIAPVFLAEGAITARLDGKELNTEARLTLRVQSGQVKEWRLLVPLRAELKFGPEDQARVARVERSDQKQTSLRTIHLKEATSDPLGVVVAHGQPAPKPATGKAAPIGPFAVLGAARHAGSLLVCNAMPTWHPEFTPNADLTRRSVSDEEQRREPTCVAAFRYGPGTPTPDEPGGGAVSWLDVEVELVRGQIKTRATHQLQLKADADGGHWHFLTSLEIAPRWADVDHLTVQLPPGCALREEGHFPLPDRVQSIGEDPATHVVTIRLARGTNSERSVAPILVKLEGVFSARVDLEVPGKVSLALPVPIGTVQGEGTITVTTPPGVELVAPDDAPPWAGLEVVRQTSQEVALRYARRAPASLPLTWRPHRPDVVVANSADVTLAAGEVRVRQELRYAWPAGPAPRFKLRVPGEIAAGLQKVQGGRLVGLEGESGAGGVKGLIPDGATRQGQELIVVFEYGYALPPARPGVTTLPLVAPLGVSRGDARVRLWSDPGHLPGRAGDWAEQDIEAVSGRSRLPVLVLHSSRVDSPLRVTLGERAGLFALVDRSLVRVEVGSNGTQTYRVGYRLVRLEGRSLDFELPAPAPTIQLEATLDGRHIDYEILPADDAAMKGRIVRLRLSPKLLGVRPGAKPGAALLEIAYHLDPRMRGSAMTTPLVAPKLLGEPGRIPTRWSVVTPPSVVVLGPEAGPATQRTWARRGWLLAPRVDVSAAELEHWLLDADPPPGDAAAAPSLVLWHDGASSVQLIHLPQQVWLLVCSLGLVLLGLLLARLVLNEEGGPSGLRIGFVLSGVAVALVVAGLFVPNLVGQLAYGCQPGVLVLVALVGVQRLLHERYRRQIVFLPSFTRSSRKGSSLHRADPRPHGQPSTVDAPRPVGSSIDRIA